MGQPMPSQQQQQHGAMFGGQPAYAGQQYQQQVPFMPGPPDSSGQQGAQGDAQMFMPTIGGMSPLNLIAGSTLFQGGQTWGQQYVQKVQQRMSWLSGGPLSFHFNVSNMYVVNKIFMLFAPFLRRWTYSRQPDQSNQHAHFLPPKADVNSPDLYIPTMALWTYVVGICFTHLLGHSYKPEVMYAAAWSGCWSWGVNALVMYVVLRAMSLPSSVPWMELLSYTGYSYVYACVIVGTGVLFGRTAYYVSWLYCAMCMAIFLVSTLKRAVFQEARNLGHDMSRVNYMLLALALWQLPYLFWLSNVKLPEVTLLSLPAAAAAGGAARVAARAAMDATGKGGGNAVADSLAGDRL